MLPVCRAATRVNKKQGGKVELEPKPKFNNVELPIPQHCSRRIFCGLFLNTKDPDATFFFRIRSKWEQFRNVMTLLINFVSDIKNPKTRKYPDLKRSGSD